MISEVLSLPDDLREVLVKGERIVWAGKPRKVPYVLRYVFFTVTAVPFMVAPLFVYSLAPRVLFQTPVIIFFLIWEGILVLLAMGPVYDFVAWKNVWYVLTNERVVVRKGVVGIDYDMLDLGNIQEVNVNVGFLDKIYGTGSIVLQSIGVRPLVLYAVEKPYEVQKLIREAVEKVRESR